MSGVLCDSKMPVKLKRKVYQTVVRPAFLYGTECWTMYNTYNRQLETTEMCMLRWAAGVSLRDRIKSSRIRGSLGVTDINSKLEERQLRWYGHIERRPTDHIVNQAIAIDIPRTTARGRPKNTWMMQRKDQMQRHGVGDLAQHRREYSLRTRRADPSSLHRR